MLPPCPRLKRISAWVAGDVCACDHSSSSHESCVFKVAYRSKSSSTGPVELDFERYATLKTHDSCELEEWSQAHTSPATHADMRFNLGQGGNIYVINRADGVIRRKIGRASCRERE